MGGKAKKRPLSAVPVVWVVGASSGIGREIARVFASIGCLVCLSARRKGALLALSREIEGWGGRTLVVPCDVSKPSDISGAMKKIRTHAGTVDILVNNAGITVFKSFARTSLTEFSGIISTNLLGPIACLKAVVPAMIARRSGWIFNIISNAAVRTFEESSAYTATKSGMLGLGRVIREELRNFNVRVVNIMPGATDTGMWSAADRKRFGKRMMSPRSIAEALLAVYLMPDDVVADELIIRPVRGDVG